MRQLDPAKQAAFIKTYKDLLNLLGDDAAVLFGDAVHPTRGVHPAGRGAEGLKVPAT